MQHRMEPSRDLFDWLVGAFTIVGAVVLALAATLAFLIQRARYLVETEPDVRFARLGNVIADWDWSPAAGRWTIAGAAGTVVANNSRFPAFDLELRCQVDGWEVETDDGTSSSSELLGGEEDRLSVMIDLPGAAQEVGPAKLQILGKNIPLYFELSYRSPRTLLNLILVPWTGGRLTYTRARTFVAKWAEGEPRDADDYGWGWPEQGVLFIGREIEAGWMQSPNRTRPDR